MLNLNRKKKIVWSALAVMALTLPVSVFTINKISSTQDTHAANLPSGFNDQNFYNCVSAEFRTEFPNETISSTGLTDAQLSKIARLMCDGDSKSDSEKINDTSGIEKMSGLKMINLANNKISKINLRTNLASVAALFINGNPDLGFLDLSGNPAITSLHVDNILVKTTLLNPKSVEPNLTYDLSGVKFLNQTTQTIGGQNESYNWNTGILTINHFENDYVQVTAQNNIETFKLQLPLFAVLDKNGGTGNIFLPSCYTVAEAKTCSIVIPDISLPRKNNLDCDGYADSDDATEATYLPGQSVEISAPKIMYAVYANDDTDPGDDTDTDPGNDTDTDPGDDADMDSDGDITVPNTSSGRTPETGGNFATDGNSATGTSYILPVSLGLGLITLIICCVARRHNRIKL